MQGAEILKEETGKRRPLALPHHDHRGDRHLYTSREKQITYEMDQIQSFIDAQAGGYRLKELLLSKIKLMTWR